MRTQGNTIKGPQIAKYTFAGKINVMSGQTTKYI